MSEDTISRQAAIDAIDEISREVDDGYGFDYAKWRQYFCELPSALGTNLAEDGTDCISRQAAINKILGQPPEPHYPSWYAEQIKELPPAEPKKGRWISADAMFGGVPFYCSECGENTRDTVMGKPRWKYCPMCGAKMRGEKDD